jgi:hypothetical protein
VCTFVYVSSALTLSEVRSMLPADLTADALPMAEQQPLLALHYDAQVVVRVLHGGCSCDLVRDRHPDPKVDEVVHRQRYRHLGYDRTRIIRYLDRHRRVTGDRRPRPTGYWGDVFNAFVVEHARNAGPTLYYRHFSHDGLPGDSGLATPIHQIAVTEVRGEVSSWLPELTPTMVT